MEKILTFKEALQEAEGKKHILLGNGFSIACDSKFHYSSLYEETEKCFSDQIKNIFKTFDTTNFEEILKNLKISQTLLNCYKESQTVETLLQKDYKEIRELLIKKLCQIHPENPSILKNKIESSVKFISNFGNIFTTNYDLLLYWTLLKKKENCNDGFCANNWKTQEQRYESSFEKLIWKETEKQNIFYLHGALHLFNKDTDLFKLSWDVTNNKTLKDIISENLNENNFPSIVTEGTAEEKKRVINQSKYLTKCSNSLEDLEDSLFTFGFSFNDNDDHIKDCIEKSKISNLYIGLLGNKNENGNDKIVGKIEQIRINKSILKVEYYSAESANVWENK